MGAHAVRNASGSKRWMNCPGSIRLADELERQGLISPSSSHYARLGTAAHGLCEVSLKQMRPPRDWLGGVVYLDDNEDTIVIPPYPDDGEHAQAEHAEAQGWEGFPIDDNMADAVAVYWQTVLDDLEEMGPHAELSVERRFDLSWLVGFDFDFEAWEADPAYVSPSGIHWALSDETPEGGLYHADGRRCWGPMFGTNDASLLLPFDLLRVYDYKHGQGVLVEVEENSQEMYYALGVMQEIGWSVPEIELVIVQPRAPHADGAVRRWRFTAERLRQFEKELREAAHRVEDPNAGLKAGDHCGFCPAASRCDELREQAFATAALEFDVVDGGLVLTTTAEVTEQTPDDALRLSLEAAPMLDAFVKAVEAEAMRRLREAPGGEAFGFKLVRKRSNRAWVGGDIPVESLVELGFPRDELYEAPKPKGPAKVEKLRPPELMARLKAEGVRAPATWVKQQVAELCHKPEGGITIAAASDPRPAVDPSAAAMADFDAAEDFGED